MPFSLILSFILLLIAIYEIYPEYDKKNIKYKINKNDYYWLGGLFVLIVGYLYFNSYTWKRYELVGIHVEVKFVYNLLLFVYLIKLGYIFWRKLRTKKIIEKDLFLKNIEQQYFNKRYNELLLNFQTYKDTEIFEKIFDKDFISNMIRNKKFIKEVINFNHYLAIDILKQEISIEQKKIFLKLYLRELFNDSNSFIFEEINTSNNFKSKGFGYKIPDNNKLLKYLMKKKNFKKINLPKIIGNFCEEEIVNQRNKNNDELNNFESYTNLYWEKSENNLIYGSIKLFDIMIRESVYHNIDDHMDVGFYYDVVKEMIKNNNYEKRKDEIHLEFANYYEYFIYKIVDNMCEWIRYPLNINFNFNLRVKKNGGNKYKIHNIIYATMYQLRFVLSDIANSDLREKFKIYIYEKLLYILFKYYKNEKNDTITKKYLKSFKYLICDYKTITENLARIFYKYLYKTIYEEDNLAKYGKNSDYPKWNIFIYFLEKNKKK